MIAKFFLMAAVFLVQVSSAYADSYNCLVGIGDPNHGHVIGALNIDMTKEDDKTIAINAANDAAECYSLVDPGSHQLVCAFRKKNSSLEKAASRLVPGAPPRIYQRNLLTGQITAATAVVTTNRTPWVELQLEMTDQEGFYLIYCEYKP